MPVPPIIAERAEAQWPGDRSQPGRPPSDMTWPQNKGDDMDALPSAAPPRGNKQFHVITHECLTGDSLRCVIRSVRQGAVLNEGDFVRIGDLGPVLGFQFNETDANKIGSARPTTWPAATSVLPSRMQSSKPSPTTTTITTSNPANGATYVTTVVLSLPLPPCTASICPLSPGFTKIASATPPPPTPTDMPFAVPSATRMHDNIAGFKWNNANFNPAAAAKAKAKALAAPDYVPAQPQDLNARAQLAEGAPNSTTKSTPGSTSSPHFAHPPTFTFHQSTMPLPFTTFSFQHTPHPTPTRLGVNVAMALNPNHLSHSSFQSARSSHSHPPSSHPTSHFHPTHPPLSPRSSNPPQENPYSYSKHDEIITILFLGLVVLGLLVLGAALARRICAKARAMRGVGVARNEEAEMGVGNSVEEAKSVGV